MRAYKFLVEVVLLFSVSVFGAVPSDSPDLDGSEFVDMNDFARFAANWQQTGSGLEGDFDDSGLVDINDLRHFVFDWAGELTYPPVAYDQNVIVTQGCPIEITLQADDENGDALDFVMIAYSENGPLTVDGNTASYTSFASYDGNDVFEFLAHDGDYESNIAKVNIIVKPDTDGDGLSDEEETTIYNTDPNDPDSDTDTMPDGWEVKAGLNPTFGDGGGDKDGDSLSNENEYLAGTDPNDSDSDNDNLTDGAEVNVHNTDPTQQDTDGDKVRDDREVNWGLEPDNPDTDGDGLDDGYEVSYHDGRYDVYVVPPPGGQKWSYTWDEFQDWDLNANLADTDEDGTPDGWESHYNDNRTDETGPDPRVDDTSPTNQQRDADGDGLENIEEYQYSYNGQQYLYEGYLYQGTDPTKQDTDGDGIDDDDEVTTQIDYIWDGGNYSGFTNALSVDTDGDGLVDGDSMAVTIASYPEGVSTCFTYGENYWGCIYGEEQHANEGLLLRDDTDLDGFDDGWEFMYYGDTYTSNPVAPISSEDKDFGVSGDGLTVGQEYFYGTSPRDGDSDSDGLSDGDEVNTYGTDPADDDSDDDGLSDGDEITAGTDPYDFDSDDDLLPDGWEVDNGLNPNSDSGDDGLNGDPDGDGASNFDEMKYGTNPNDGNSNPAALMDAGKQYLDVKLTIGDHSGSHSERYNLKVGSITHQAPEFGVVETEVYPFEVGKKYDIEIVHVDSNLPTPDYDYTALVEPNDYYPAVGWILEDDDDMLGVHGESTEFYAQGKTASLTLLAVDELVWETYGNNAAPDTCPNNGGKRIFPGKQDPDDTSTDRRKVKIKATIAPATEGQTVWFRWYDADDPSLETPLDPTGPGGYDNFGKNAYFGEGDWNGGGLTSATTNADGEASLEFTVSTQPGDNFRVFASLCEADLRMPEINHDKMESLQNLPNGVTYSKMLTVWRKLWIERDSMGEVATTGPEQNYFPTRATEYEVFAPSNPYTIVTFNGGFYNAYGVDWREPNHFRFGTMAEPLSSSWSYRTVNSGDPDGTPPGWVKISEDMTLPGNPVVPFDCTLYDDDWDRNTGDYHVTLPDCNSPELGTFQSAYDEAYIVVDYLDSAYSDEVSFKRNLPDSHVTYPTGYDWDNERDVSGGGDFWTALVVSCYQPKTSEDFDPDTETGATRGQTTAFCGNKCVLYLETTRDVGDSLGGVMAHELGHTGGCGYPDHCSNPGCLMQDDASGTNFCDDCKKQLRKDRTW